MSGSDSSSSVSTLSSSSAISDSSGVFLDWILDDVSEKDFAEASQELSKRRETLRYVGCSPLTAKHTASSPNIPHFEQSLEKISSKYVRYSIPTKSRINQRQYNPLLYMPVLSEDSSYDSEKWKANKQATQKMRTGTMSDSFKNKISLGTTQQQEENNRKITRSSSLSENTKMCALSVPSLKQKFPMLASSRLSSREQPLDLPSMIDLRYKINVTNCKMCLTPFLFESFSSPIGKQWNDQFQSLFGGRILLSLNVLLSEFIQEVHKNVKIIIDDLNELKPHEERRITIYERDGSRRVGEYVKNQIFYKIVSNQDGVFLDDNHAQKAIKQQIRALSEYSTKYVELLLEKPHEQKLESELHFPLVALVNYRGHCVSACAVMPPTIGTIFGSDDGMNLQSTEAKTSAILETIAAQLNLQKHVVVSLGGSKKAFTNPGDIQVDLGIDDRVYVVDAAGLFPPTGPFTEDRRNLISERFRVEFIANSKNPINPDEFKVWNDESQSLSSVEDPVFKKRIITMLKELLIETVTRIAFILDDKENTLPEDSQMSRAIHRYGPNWRFMGFVYSKCRSSIVRKHLLIEMTARALKFQLNAVMAQPHNLNTLKTMLAQKFNRLLENNKEEWDNLRETLRQKFFLFRDYQQLLSTTLTDPPEDLVAFFAPQIPAYKAILAKACQGSGIKINRIWKIQSVDPQAIEFTVSERLPLYFHPKELKSLFTYAVSMDNKEKYNVYQKIIELCKSFSDAKPDDYYSFLEWGKARLEQASAESSHSELERSKMLTDALEAFSEALIIKVDLPEAYYGCGLALKEKAKLQEGDVNSMLSNLPKIESWLGSAERVMQTAIALTESSQQKVDISFYSSLAEIFQLQAEIHFQDEALQEKFNSKALVYFYLALEENPWSTSLRKAAYECRTKRKKGSFGRIGCILKTGFLTKQGAINKNWKKRYFVLNEEQLLYFTNEKSTMPKGKIFLSEVTDASLNDKFLIQSRYCLAVTCPKRCYYLTSDYKDTVVEWQRAVQATLSVLQYEREL